jgi:hypothetical protein
MLYCLFKLTLNIEYMSTLRETVAFMKSNALFDMSNPERKKEVLEVLYEKLLNLISSQIDDIQSVLFKEYPDLVVYVSEEKNMKAFTEAFKQGLVHMLEIGLFTSDKPLMYVNVIEVFEEPQQQLLREVVASPEVTQHLRSMALDLSNFFVSSGTSESDNKELWDRYHRAFPQFNEVILSVPIHNNLIQLNWVTAHPGNDLCL